MSLDDSQLHGGIELLWPGKGDRPVQSPETGEWDLLGAVPGSYSISRVRMVQSIGVPPWCVLISGDRLESLEFTRRLIGRGAALTYFDLPRLSGFDDARAFAGPSDRRWAVWLSMVREHMASALRLLRPSGVMVAVCGNEEFPYAKALAAEQFGRENEVGTIVWRAHYSPKGNRKTSDIVQIHQYLIVFAASKEALGEVSLPLLPDGYDNPDGDPRGPWQAPQKDAGRDTARVAYRVPPYRWELVKGPLPRGLWRVSPFSGVIWGTPEEAGSFEILGRVHDKEGRTGEQTISLEIRQDPREVAGPSATDNSVWWMDTPPELDSGPPRIEPELPVGFVGEVYRGFLVAQGGSPDLREKRPSRGWAFGQATLNSAIREDRCHFGKKGDAIPEPKKYLRDLEGGFGRANVVSFWDGQDVGWTQDATKHLNELGKAGVVGQTGTLAKPERMLARLLQIFSKPGDAVVEVFGSSADFSASALKMGRRPVFISGAGPGEVRALEQVALPRISAVISGADPLLDGAEAPIPGDTAVGGLSLLSIDPNPLAILERPAESPRLAMTADLEGLPNAVLISQGFLPSDSQDDPLFLGWGGACAVALGVDEFLTTAKLFQLATHVEARPFYVYYFRKSADFETRLVPDGVVIRRVPMELAV